MAQTGNTARNIIIWTFERGTLPYDILCGLILAFVFLVPRSCFAPKRPDAQTRIPAVQSSSPIKADSATPPAASALRK